LLWVLQFQSQQEAKHLQTLGSSIYVVAEEEVVEASDVTRLAWGLPDVEEAHQVVVISVNVSKDFYGRLEVVLDQNGLPRKHLLALSNQVDDLLLLNVEWLEKAFGYLTILWLEKILDKD